MRTMKELCREAIAIQDASNLSGIAHSFSRTMTDLRALLVSEGDFSTTKLNQHPVCVLYSSKITSLTGSEVDGSFTSAYRFCREQSDNQS